MNGEQEQTGLTEEELGAQGATALPDNGDPSGVQTLTEILASLHVAQDAVRSLVKRMCAIVAANGGRITDIETDVRA